MDEHLTLTRPVVPKSLNFQHDFGHTSSKCLATRLQSFTFLRNRKSQQQHTHLHRLPPGRAPASVFDDDHETLTFPVVGRSNQLIHDDLRSEVPRSTTAFLSSCLNWRERCLAGSGVSGISQLARLTSGVHRGAEAPGIFAARPFELTQPG